MANPKKKEWFFPFGHLFVRLFLYLVTFHILNSIVWIDYAFDSPSIEKILFHFMFAYDFIRNLEVVELNIDDIYLEYTLKRDFIFTLIALFIDLGSRHFFTKTGSSLLRVIKTFLSNLFLLTIWFSQQHYL